MCHIAEDSSANQGLRHALYMIREVSPPSSALGEEIAGRRTVSSSEVLHDPSASLLCEAVLMIQTLNILERTHICGKGVAESLGELAFRGCSIALFT
jgi:hypothetical protein